MGKALKPVLGTQHAQVPLKCLCTDTGSLGTGGGARRLRAARGLERSDGRMEGRLERHQQFLGQHQDLRSYSAQDRDKIVCIFIQHTGTA